MLKRLCLSSEMKDGRRVDVRFLLSDTYYVGFGSLITPGEKTYSEYVAWPLFDLEEVKDPSFWDKEVEELSGRVFGYAAPNIVPLWFVICDCKKRELRNMLVTHWHDMFPGSAFALDKWEVLEK
ncbi:MAG: hypothetical protein IJG83_02950 [Thermoguttaceae bacterium]|nr:hypothetical protein [Thermoguttaceae bacterium]